MANGVKKVQTSDRNINQLQTNIITPLNQLLSNPLLLGTILTAVVLKAGLNVVPTKLDRTLQGWIIVRQDSAATFFDTQVDNPNPSTTLYLNASAPVTVNLYVF